LDFRTVEREINSEQELHTIHEYEEIQNSDEMSDIYPMDSVSQIGINSKRSKSRPKTTHDVFRTSVVSAQCRKYDLQHNAVRPDYNTSSSESSSHGAKRREVSDYNFPFTKETLDEFKSQQDAMSKTNKISLLLGDQQARQQDENARDPFIAASVPPHYASGATSSRRGREVERNDNLNVAKKSESRSRSRSPCEDLKNKYMNVVRERSESADTDTLRARYAKSMKESSLSRSQSPLSAQNSSERSPKKSSLRSGSVELFGRHEGGKSVERVSPKRRSVGFSAVEEFIQYPRRSSSHDASSRDPSPSVPLSADVYENEASNFVGYAEPAAVDRSAAPAPAPAAAPAAAPVASAPETDIFDEL